MKLTGLIGGMSWESTAEYYRLFNESVRSRLGGTHSAPLIVYSFDFAPIEALQHDGEWDRLASTMIEAAIALVNAGAEQLLLCTNTMHAIYPQLETAVETPIIHIVDATSRRIVEDRVRRVGLLGTRYTMEEAFYRDRLEQSAIEVIIPEGRDCEIVHQTIYDELCRGVVTVAAKREFLRIIETLVVAGAEGIVLGCTEIPLLIRPGDADVPVYDTTALHVDAAIEEALR